MKELVKSTKKKIKKLEKKEFKKRWNEVRQKVKETQENKCYVCKKEVYGKSAHIHHIVDRRVKELFLDENNLVLLCPLCHKLGSLSVHTTAICFGEILRRNDLKRYNYLIDIIEKYHNNTLKH
jgi:hypothetical protein